MLSLRPGRILLLLWWTVLASWACAAQAERFKFIYQDIDDAELPAGIQFFIPRAMGPGMSAPLGGAFVFNYPRINSREQVAILFRLTTCGRSGSSD